MDAVDKWESKLLKKVENRLKVLYQSALDAVNEMSDHYINGWTDGGVHHEGMQDRYFHEKLAYKAGLYHDPDGNLSDQEVFKRWWEAQEGRSQYYIDWKNDIAETLTHTNDMARKIVNGETPQLFYRAYNGIKGMATKAAIDQGILGVRFDIMDENQLRALIDGKISGTIRKMNLDLDKDKKWNIKAIENAMIKGILAGDSFDALAKRLEPLVRRNKSAAMACARTAFTASKENGRQMAREDLAEQGCDTMKIWIDIHDSIPPERPAHWEASGQEVPFDQPFIVGGEELMYPGDPAGSGWNTIRCRCCSETSGFRFRSVLTEEQRKSANITVRYVPGNGIHIV